MSKAKKSYTDQVKEMQEKLKKRSEELFRNGPDFDEPQSTGNPDKIFEDDEKDSKENSNK